MGSNPTPEQSIGILSPWMSSGPLAVSPRSGRATDSPIALRKASVHSSRRVHGGRKKSRIILPRDWAPSHFSF